jgi:Tfp pilus assembly protein PilN
MMRINLLPPEILEKRKSERRLVYVVLVAVLVVIVLAGVYGFANLQLSDKNKQVTMLEQELAEKQNQAQSLVVFELNADELARRTTIAQTALASRINWSQLYDELSLIMPSDLWVTVLVTDQTSGLQLDGFAVDSETDSPDLGHKSIAKLLVRLADLDQLRDVWLTNAAKTTLGEDAAIQFSVTAGVDASMSTSLSAGN